MAVLLDSAVSPRYDELPAVASRIDGMIEANKKRFTASISLNDEAARPLAHKTEELLRRAGFLIAGQKGVYAVFINFDLCGGRPKTTAPWNPPWPLGWSPGTGRPW
ncbi:MAG: hypothetical protein LBE14_04760 [Treponema sp.]|jgi:hypothetical protein|nr:hypothetical protein [Treponema sp.]